MAKDKDIIFQTSPAQDLLIELQILAQSIWMARVFPEDLVIADKSEFMLKDKIDFVLKLF